MPTLVPGDRANYSIPTLLKLTMLEEYPEQSELGHSKRWQQNTDAVAIGIQLLRDQIEIAQKLKSKKFTGEAFENFGTRFSCVIPTYPEIVQEYMPTGTEIVITSKDNGRKSILTGVVQEIKGSDDGLATEIIVDLHKEGRCYGWEVDIKPATNVKRLKKQLALVQKPHHRIHPPERAIIEGDFRRKQIEGLQSNPNLDKVQNTAYGKAMATEEYPVLFIHGGPGTGKTHTMCKVIKGHAKQGNKVLVLSHSNKGSQVPALKLKEDGVEVHVAGQNASKIDPKLHEDRILRKINFPIAKMKEIDSKTEEDLCIELGVRSLEEVHMEIHEVKDLQREKIQEEFERRKDKAAANLRDSLEKGGVAFSTLGTLLNDDILKETDFDVVMIDEATRLRYWHMVQALQKAEKQLIFVGDPLQLGNIPFKPQTRERITDHVKKAVSRISRGGFIHEPKDPDYQLREASLPTVCVECFEEGPFTSAIENCEDPHRELPYVFLDQDRRSLPNIVNVLSELIYDGKLKAGRESAENEHEGIVQWVDTSDLKTKEQTKGTSRINSFEARIVANKVLARLFSKDPKVKLEPEDIGIIATYAAQAKQIRKYLKRKLRKNPELLDRLLPNVATVDSFQGDERKVIFVSTTRSNEEGNIGFLEERRRLGVAIGRAQEELYIVGDVDTIVERNDQPDSKAFFTKMRDLIEEHGEVKKEPYKKKFKRKRKRISKTEKRLREIALLNKPKKPTIETYSSPPNQW